jgi:hypothetical protein
MHSMLTERVKTWTEEWEQRGLQRGLEQGIQKGMHQGESQLLRRMLQHRFGPVLPDWVEARLAVASTDQLEAWGLAFVDAQTLEQVFAEERPD